jgi:hypothetical protein
MIRQVFKQRWYEGRPFLQVNFYSRDNSYYTPAELIPHYKKYLNRYEFTEQTIDETTKHYYRSMLSVIYNDDIL